MNSPLNILHSYSDAFRELVNARVWATNESPEKALRLNAAVDWDFICVAMDVVGDAALALESFLRFALDGPSRYEDVGEKYLRLYGLLSATYLQQEAVLKLYSLMNCPNPKAVRAELNALEIRTLRHQVASHSVDYLPPDGRKTLAFVPVRVGLLGFSCTVTESRGGKTRTVRLDQAVETHCLTMISVLDRIYEKSITTFFRGQDKRIAEFTRKLEDLRFIRDGNLLIRGGDQENPVEIRIVFVAPPPGEDTPTRNKRRTRGGKALPHEK
jgi:hypothetical protein